MYKAVEVTNNNQVALKHFHISAGEDNTFMDEFNLIKSLCHDNVIRVYDFIAINDRPPVIVMELAPDGSLKDRLTVPQLRLYESAARGIAIGMLRGLEYLHSNNILHCDIKPSNILLFGSTVKFCDFGLSKRCDVSASEGYRTEKLFGSPLYMALEIFNERTYTQASDIWVLGCTLVELVSGKVPWADVTPRAGAVPPDSLLPRR